MNLISIGEFFILLFILFIVGSGIQWFRSIYDVVMDPPEPELVIPSAEELHHWYQQESAKK